MYSGRFAKTTNIQKCVVSICNATSCFNNESKECVLKEVSIDEEGKCMQFKPQQKRPKGGC